METKPYIMLRRKPFFIEEIHTVESSCFKVCYEMSFNGEILIKLKSRPLQKALDFCEKRPSSPSKADFDHKFLQDVQQSGLNLVDLIVAAGRLGINNLVNLLFDAVYKIICSKEPVEVEKIFKANGRHFLCFSLIDQLLNYAPPCPTLSEEYQVKLQRRINHQEILKVSPAVFKTLPDGPQKRYWVYVHLVMKCNPHKLAHLLSKEERAEEEEDEEEEEQAKEDEEEESKVPKTNDDVGGPAWKRGQPVDAC